ncbi:MAG: long-chain fatty acid--CoA ligase [Fimbriimonadaceae bacterium]|nr:MAG: long-chain fatty acid--CoA ligase [Fimbriimonadaceae bacterium]
MVTVTPSKSLGAQMRSSAARWPERISHMIPQGKEFVSVTFSEFEQQVFESAQALHNLGLRKGDRLAIIGETSFDWALVDWGCQTLGIVSVPIYPTLPADQAQYIADDCGAKLVICSDAKQSEKISRIPVLVWKEGEGETYKSHAANSELTFEKWADICDSVETDALATLIYTSGTTGNPKGVMLSHKNFLSLNINIQNSLPVDENDVFLSWLPVSHVFERYAGHALPVSIGATIAYATSITTLASDMAKVKPTILLAVPRFLESLKSKILDGVAKKKPIEQKLFHLTLSQGLKKFRGEFAPLAGILDKVVASKVRERTGGRLRYIASGGAALAPHVAEFFLALNINVLQGYGLTETCAASSLNPPDQNKPWTVGVPIGGVEIKIAADGEILQRGDSVMSGYYNLPQETSEAIDAEGWFHTGDIGEFEGKHLKITDRKKDLLVLGNGKNVAPQPVENRLKESEYIAEVVLLGDGMEHCCALVIPDFERVETWLKSQGQSQPDPSKLVLRDDVKQLIRSEIDAANKKMADFERVRKHVLVPKAFSVDDGELTPSMKVRRKVVKEKYADLIDAMKK